MGHPEPFHLTMIGIGNEQWGTRYVDRYKVFAAALKAQHPEIKLVVAAGPFPTGEPFDSMWATWRTLHADIVDEHYYMSPDWFLTNTNRYDNYDRSGPKVFAGEYAAQTVQSTSPDNKNNWLDARRVWNAGSVGRALQAVAAADCGRQAAQAGPGGGVREEDGSSGRSGECSGPSPGRTMAMGDVES